MAERRHRIGLMGEMGEEVVATIPGDPDVPGAERAADPLLGDGRRVHGVVQEPRAVVVPEVVVGVVQVDPERGGLSARGHVMGAVGG